MKGKPDRGFMLGSLLFWLVPPESLRPGHSSQEPQSFATFATEIAPSLNELVPLLRLFTQEEPAFETVL